MPETRATRAAATSLCGRIAASKKRTDAAVPLSGRRPPQRRRHVGRSKAKEASPPAEDGERESDRGAESEAAVEDEEEEGSQDGIEDEAVAASPDESVSASDSSSDTNAGSGDQDARGYEKQGEDVEHEYYGNDDDPDDDDDDDEDSDDDGFVHINPMDPRATPDSAALGITATYLIACGITSSLSCEKSKLAPQWDSISRSPQYKLMVNDKDCADGENVRRVKLLDAFMLWQKMRRRPHTAELIACRPQLIDKLIDLIGTKLPPPPLYESKRTAKILVNLLTQKYIAIKLTKASDGLPRKKTARDIPLHEDTDFLTLWEQGGHPVPVDDQGIILLQKRVENDIRTRRLPELARLYSWEKCLQQVNAFLIEIGEYTENEVDLDEIAELVEVHAITSLEKRPNAGGSSGDGGGHYGPGSSEDSDSSGPDVEGNQEEPTNGLYREENDDDDEDDFQLSPALLGDLVANIMTREDTLAAANAARKGKGRARPDSERMTPTPNPRRARPKARNLSHDEYGDPDGDAEKYIPTASLSGRRRRRNTASPDVSSGDEGRAGLTAEQAMRGLESAGRKLRRDVQDPIERLYPAVDREFPRQSPRLQKQQKTATNKRKRRSAAPAVPAESDSSSDRMSESSRDHAKKKHKRAARKSVVEARALSASPPPLDRAPSVPREASAQPAPAAQAGPRKRTAWSEEDIAELDRGLTRYRDEYARWKMILEDGLARGRFAGRTNVMLKDKARQMKTARIKAGLPLGGFIWAPDRAEN
ncbi:hypothetical protein HDU87_006367 [Geranomyces variabilis]|uniref:Uncharacterized protein n=1 Tax=Geranomyces variabilis TaxID=109894 RepID=A0AAD5TL23_9FUNG|nr:hypothetical protein HDU87_006367 [Geranomyces variabilis]